MQKQITLENKEITYTLRKSKRATRVRLSVYPDGAIVVTAPHFFGDRIAERFLSQKSDWLLSKLSYFAQFKPISKQRDTRAEYEKYVDDARMLITRKVEHFSTLYKQRYNKISIKNQKTCWGSCSKRRNLNFNYKILFLPERVQDYVVAHEICHLAELNHSKKFWGLLAQTIPDYKQVRRELKKYRVVNK